MRKCSPETEGLLFVDHGHEQQDQRLPGRGGRRLDP